jgi:AraC-like DNA-binding protein
MALLAPNQMTFSFEPGLPERFATLRAYVAHRAATQTKSMKAIAADMDMSPSTLSRKLNPAEGDTQRFNVDDLEDYLKSTNDAPAVIEYLASKYMDSPEARKARTLTKVESMLPELAMLLATLKAS